MHKNSFVHAIFIGQPKTITDERGTWRSSIYRNRAEQPVQVQKGGLEGDKVTQSYHGGPDAAICVHLLDHYRFWNEQYAMSLQAGNVGENFALDGVSEADVCAGDVVRVGSALLQVSSPRVPCANQARRIGRADWVRLTIDENRTGFYMRVLEPGVVQAGDAWDLNDRLNPDGSVSALNRQMYHHFDPAFAQRVLQMQGLAEWWKQQTHKRLKVLRAQESLK